MKKKLRAGESLVGCFVMVPSPSITEMVAYAGFDFLILDTEHGSATPETLENQLRAAEAAGVPALVRTVGMTQGEILRIMDAGATGILVPHVCVPEEAASIAAAAHYPPHGVRGLATTARAGRHGFTTLTEHLNKAYENTVVLVQIEDAKALDHVSAIAALDNIDGIFIGPADLSISLGHPGNPGHPTVVAAIDKVVKDTVAAGSVASTFVRSSAEVADVRKRGIPIAVFSSTSLFSQVLGETVRSAKSIA
ncbi:MAG TPA: aldolase/citrate lyase family protein [Mesorhizobium sp.]